jgi:hypothetical protein
MDVQTLTYHGTTKKGLEIQVDGSFLLGDEIMVNATEMAKPFGYHKRPEKWLRTQRKQDLIRDLADAHKCASADLVEITKGVIIKYSKEP